MDGWVLINKCIKCNGFPFIIPGNSKKEKLLICHCKDSPDEPCNIDEWNTKNPKPDTKKEEE